MWRGAEVRDRQLSDRAGDQARAVNLANRSSADRSIRSTAWQKPRRLRFPCPFRPYRFHFRCSDPHPADRSTLPLMLHHGSETHGAGFGSKPAALWRDVRCKRASPRQTTSTARQEIPPGPCGARGPGGDQGRAHGGLGAATLWVNIGALLVAGVRHCTLLAGRPAETERNQGRTVSTERPAETRFSGKGVNIG